MSEFLRGFATATGLDQQEASEQWSAFSRQLSDAEIADIEAGEYESGLEEGKKFTKFYPAD